MFIEKGFTRSSVEEICRNAGTTKGAFFHHFESKQEVGLLALDRFARTITAELAGGVADRSSDPLQRVFDYLDRSIVIGQQFQPFPTCLVAVMTLELAANNTFRAAAKEAFARWLDDLEGLMGDAIAASPRAKNLEARSLAELFLATLEGSLILARARGDRTVIERNVSSFKSHLRRLLS